LQLGDIVSDFTFLRSDGSSVVLSTFSAKAIVMIFLRHLSWIPCRAHLGEIRNHYEEIRRLGGDVLVVSFARPAFLALYERDQALPFTLVTDPSLTAYHAFGLKHASWPEILRGRVLWRYLRLMVRGWAPQRGNKGEDVLQLGGDFVLDEARRLVYAHRSAEPTDRPPVAELLQAVARAARSW
jgi:peroxiredoxin